MAGPHRPALPLTTLVRFARHYMARYLHWYLAGTLMLAATNWLSVSIPLILAEGIDALSLGESGRPVLLRSALWIGVMGVLVIAVRTASRLLFFTPGRLVEAEVKRDLFDRLIHQQAPFLDRWPTGDLLSRASSDVTMARLMAGFAALGAVNTVVALGLTGAQMWRISPPLALITSLPLIAGMVITVVAAGRLRALMRDLQEQAAAMSDQILASYQGVATVHAFRAEPAFEARFAEHSERWLELVLDQTRVRVAIGPLLSAAAALDVFLLLAVGGPLAIQGDLTVGELVAFTTLVAYLVGPVRGLSFIVSLFRQSQSALERIDAILLPPIERPDLPDPRPPPTAAPALAIRGLSFAYPDDPDRPVLHDVNLEVPAGGTLGILGPTGSGKTTLLRVLARVYNPPPGTVFVDGVDIRSVDLDGWRRAMQLVQQRAQLFSESVRDNILLGRPDEGRLDQVVALTALGPDVAALPAGLDTVVGEAGLTLSGGQRQRVALARGLVAPKHVLMLDDVLSAVDHATERELLESLRHRGAAPTTVIVSNRCSALQHADVIAVIEDGRVTATGRHAELCARPGLYRDVWAKQHEAEPAS